MIVILMWIVTGIAIAGFFLNMAMNKWGYIVWIISNIGLATNDIYVKQYPEAGLFIFYTVMCAIGFYQWSKKNEKKSTKETSLVVLKQTLDKNFKKGDVCYYTIGGGDRWIINMGSGK